MNKKFYIAFDNNIIRKAIFLIIIEENKKNDCWCLTEADHFNSWVKCRDVFKEIHFFEISKKTYLKLRELNDWQRRQINNFIYYVDLFKYWGVYEELCETLV